jgi:hypothetical protein
VAHRSPPVGWLSSHPLIFFFFLFKKIKKLKNLNFSSF